jgi:hypothetical protein
MVRRSHRDTKHNHRVVRGARHIVSARFRLSGHFMHFDNLSIWRRTSFGFVWRASDACTEHPCGMAGYSRASSRSSGFKNIALTACFPFAMSSPKRQKLDDQKDTLHYWPGAPGRGEFVRGCFTSHYGSPSKRVGQVRLAFEHAGVAYNDPMDVKVLQQFMSSKPKGPGVRPFAPPFLMTSDGLLISQTPNILSYLGDKLKLQGEKPQDRFIVHQLALVG